MSPPEELSPKRSRSRFDKETKKNWSVAKREPSDHRLIGENGSFAYADGGITIGEEKTYVG